MKKIVKVALDVPLYKVFDYSFEDEDCNISQGVRVEVPFGSKKKVGIIVETSDKSSPEHKYKIKKINQVLDTHPVLDKTMMFLCKWAADYYQHPIGQVLFSSLPTKLKQGCDRYYYSKSQLVYEANKIISKTKIVLNNDQKKIHQEIISNSSRFNVHLVEGITGSGKTEVYIKIARDIVESDGQILILVPEINLTPQTVSRFEKYLNCHIKPYHSSLTDKNKFLVWDACSNGKIDIVIGTRSSIFLPFKNLKMIIVDEEHDSSLKQTEKFKYHARDIALVRAKKLKIPVVLGSATPSFESINNANNGKFKQLHLKKRYFTKTMPTVTVVDLNKDTSEDNLSATLIRKIEKELKRGGQVLVFINKRGFSSVMMCKTCGWISKCTSCDAFMTYHRTNNCLQCHHCGKTQILSKKLSYQCTKNCEYIFLGAGTERIEKKLRDIFPTNNIIRVDSDSINSIKKLENFRQQCLEGKVDIIVGTQMLVKGHDFPNLNLVAVVDIDSALFSHDFRSTEKISQQLVQVSGRSGRKSDNSEVVIQTRVPNHPLITELLKKGYSNFSLKALENRRKTNLPPFSYLSLLRISSIKKNAPMSILDTIADKLIKDKNLKILGPAPAPIMRKNNRYIYQLIIQSNNRKLLLLKSSQIREYMVDNKKYDIRWSLDIDPIDLY